MFGSVGSNLSCTDCGSWANNSASMSLGLLTYILTWWAWNQGHCVIKRQRILLKMAQSLAHRWLHNTSCFLPPFPLNLKNKFRRTVTLLGTWLAWGLCQNAKSKSASIGVRLKVCISSRFLCSNCKQSHGTWILCSFGVSPVTESLLCQSLARWSWVSHFNFLSISFSTGVIMYHRKEKKHNEKSKRLS